MPNLEPISNFVTVPLAAWLRLGLLILCITLAYVCGSGAYKHFEYEQGEWTVSQFHNPEITEIPILALSNIWAGNIPFVTIPIFGAGIFILGFTEIYPIPVLLHTFIFIGVASLTKESASWHWGSIILLAIGCLTVAIDYILITQKLKK